MIRSTSSIIQGVGETSYRSQIRQNRKAGAAGGQFDQLLDRAQAIAKDNSEPLAPPVATQTINPSELFSKGLQYVNNRQVNADDKLQALASGKVIDIHGTMLAMKEAELSLRLATSVRDNFVQAYNRILQMQI
ncbi:MAG: flagellar hook-basal body complex protein FliE [Proteobacteria bacterium]|nr:flagellar hook-basal body complex protein FliE [Pseudomonadota bacterium]